jgi:hypothetical protein
VNGSENDRILREEGNDDNIIMKKGSCVDLSIPSDVFYYSSCD